MASLGARNYDAVLKAKLYANFRQHTPLVLVRSILDFMSKKLHQPPFGIAVDVGCGTGQSSQVLAPYFKEIWAIDKVQSNIAQAKINGIFLNVTFLKGIAESILCENNIIDLVTAGQSLHRFDDKNQFFKEAGRILKPNGVLAVYDYTSSSPLCGGETLHIKLKEFLNEIQSQTQTDLDRSLQSYESFTDHKEYTFDIAKTISGRKYMGFLRSSQSFRDYILSRGDDDAEDVLQSYISKLKQCLGVTEELEFETTQFDILHSYTLKLSRKPEDYVEE